MVGQIERWIRQRLDLAVAVGFGDWADPPPTVFGRPIYTVAHGAMTLTLSELGFSYTGPTPTVERRYDAIEALELASLQTIMKLRGDLNAPVPIGLVLRGSTVRAEMQWPLRVYSNVATVLDRIVRELA